MSGCPDEDLTLAEVAPLAQVAALAPISASRGSPQAARPAAPTIPLQDREVSRMDRKSVPGPARRHKGRKQRRPRGLAVVERNGFWHIHGTLLAQGRSIRVRESTRLPARSEHFEEADQERNRIERELRGEIAGRPGPGAHLSVAAEAYLSRKRKRPLGKTTIEHVVLCTRIFGLRLMREISNTE
jgi:hypothetical protein